MESKSTFIDYFKAFLLTCVIVVHSIEVDVGSPFTIVFYLGESFLMPVFLAVSGYLISKTSLRNERWGPFWRKYSKRFIIPFLIALIIERLWRMPNFTSFFVYLKLAGQFWFIPTLFLFILLLKISYALDFSLVKQVLLYTFFTILILIDAITIQSFQSFYFHLYYFPFFLIGHYWTEFNWKLPKFYTLIFIATWVLRIVSLLIGDEMFTIPRVLTMISTTLYCMDFIHNKAQKLKIKEIDFFISYGRNTLPVYLYHYLFLLFAYGLSTGLEYYLVAFGFVSILISTVSLASKTIKSDKIVWVFGIKPLADYFKEKKS